MTSLALACQVLLGLTFLCAGFTKLRHPASVRQTITNFGITFAPTIVANLVPRLELSLGAILVLNLMQPIASLLSIVLLTTFIVLVGRSLLNGNIFACNCFGDTISSKIGWPLLVRNLVLLAMSLVSIIGTSTLRSTIAQYLLGSSFATQLTRLIAFNTLAILVLIIITFRIVQELHAYRALAASGLERSKLRSPLAVGSLIPDLLLRDLAEQLRPLSSFVNSDALVIFVNPRCADCEKLLVSDLLQQYVSSAPVLLISRGSAAQNNEVASRVGISNIALQEADEIARLFGIVATPSAFKMNATRHLTSPVLSGYNGMYSLLSQRDSSKQELRTTTTFAAHPAYGLEV